MELYIIHGLPGVGKLAVARELTRLLPGYKLFHIHMLADLLESVFGFDGGGFIELRNRMWPMVIERAVADGIADSSPPSFSSGPCPSRWSRT